MSVDAANPGETIAVPQADLPQTDMSARNRLVIGLLLVSAFVVILNETIMGVAIPHLMADLGVSASGAQWLTTAFLLTMAVVIPITGFLLQRFNTRPVFFAAMSLFSLGTLIGAVAPGLEVLILARIVQACGTAIMMPLLMTTIMNLVPPQSRGRTMGNISIVISVAPAIGPTVSGLILSVLDWRFLFILMLPIALGALALGAARIVNVTTPRKAPIDLVSIPLAIIGFGGFVYGLSGLGEGALHTGEPPLVPAWIPIVVGLAGIVVFVLRQRSLEGADRALLDFRTLAISNFTIAAGMMAAAMMAMFGFFILMPIYLQNVLGLTTLQTGLLLLPGGLIMGLCAPTVGSLYDRLGPRPLLVPGTVLVSLVLWSLTLVTETTPVWLMLGGHFVLSIGLALMFTPLFTAALGSLPPKLYSHGSAMIGTTQQVAGAAGTALFVALLTLGTAGGLAEGLGLEAATAGGMRTAFLVGAVISLLPIAGAFLVKKADAAPGGMVH
jgi:DHA2 family lincomycin resistance protein-like MFS transporter